MERNKLLAKMGLPSDASEEDIRLKYEKLSCLFRDKLKSKDVSVVEQANKNIKILEDFYILLRRNINSPEKHLDKRGTADSASSPTSVQTNSDKGKIVCSKCGMLINQADRFCNKCGTPIGKNVRMTKKNIRRVALVVLLLVCIPIVSLYFYNKDGLNAGESAPVEIAANKTQTTEETSSSQEFRIDARNYYKLNEDIKFLLREYDSESGKKLVFALGMIAAESTGNLESLYSEHADTDIFLMYIKTYYKIVMEGRDVQLFLETLDGKTPNEVLLYAHDLHNKYNF